MPITTITPGFSYAGNARVLWNDGEDLEHGDLNDMGNFAQGFLTDVVLRDQLYSTTDIMSFEQTACYPSADAVAYRTLNGTVSGALVWAAPTTSFSSTPRSIAAVIENIDLSFVVPVTTGTDRIDSVFLRFTFVDTGDQQTRDFEDVNGVLSSITPYKKRIVKVEADYVQGTPSGTPAFPNAPDSTWRRWASYYVDGSTTTSSLLYNTNIFNHRRLIGKQRTKFVPAWNAHWDGVAWQPAGGSAYLANASSAADLFVPFGLHSGARILSVTPLGSMLSGGTIKLADFDLTTGVASIANAGSPRILLSSISLTANVAHNYATGYPVWGNVSHGGLAMDFGAVMPNTAHTLGLVVHAGSGSKWSGCYVTYED